MRERLRWGWMGGGGETLRKRTRGFGECIVLCHYRSHDNNIDDMLHTTHNI